MHYPSQGYRTIADTLLNEYGWVVTDNAVMKSMQRLNITGFVRKTKRPDTDGGTEHYRYPNILNRKKAIIAPARLALMRLNIVAFNLWNSMANVSRMMELKLDESPSMPSMRLMASSFFLQENNADKAIISKINKTVLFLIRSFMSCAFLFKSSTDPI